MIQLDTTQILLVVAILLAAYLCYLKKSKENFRQSDFGQSDAVTTLMAGANIAGGVQKLPFRFLRRQQDVGVRPASERFQLLGEQGSPSGSAAVFNKVFDESKSFGQPAPKMAMKKPAFKMAMKKPASAMKNGMGLSGEFMSAAGRKMSGVPAEGFSYY